MNLARSAGAYLAQLGRSALGPPPLGPEPVPGAPSAQRFFLISFGVVAAAYAMLWPGDPISQIYLPTEARNALSALQHVPIGVPLVAAAYFLSLFIPFWIVLRPVTRRLDAARLAEGCLHLIAGPLAVALLVSFALIAVSHWAGASYPFGTSQSVGALQWLWAATLFAIVVHVSIWQVRLVRRLTGYGVAFGLVLSLAAGALHAATFGRLIEGSVRAWSTPSGSMRPTLEVGDVVLANRFQYFFETPRAGDVFLFETPEGVPYLKRIVGLPGDIVRYSDGRLWRNGAPAPRDVVGRVEDQVSEGRLRRGGTLYEERLTEEAGYRILEQRDDLWFDETPEFDVPPAHYFALGDNRDNSRDSRDADLGMIPEDRVIGRVFFRAWPLRTPLEE